MITKLRLIGISLTLMFSLSSCFDIKEEITINKNGSGTYAFELDMSEMITMLESMKNMTDSTATEEEEDDDLLKKMSDGTNEKLQALESINGISNVKDSSEPEKGIARYQFNFKDIESLNAAYQAMSKDSSDARTGIIFEGKKGKLVRNNVDGDMVYTMLSGFAKNQGGEGADMEAAAGMFSTGSYELRVTVPKSVKKFDNEEGEAFDDQVRMSVSLDQMMLHNEYLDYSLEYK
ncbi:MAG: hypothetical protein AAF740_03650 [Bacteroidota bacterium]